MSMVQTIGFGGKVFYNLWQEIEAPQLVVVSKWFAYVIQKCVIWTQPPSLYADVIHVSKTLYVWLVKIYDNHYGWNNHGPDSTVVGLSTRPAPLIKFLLNLSFMVLKEVFGHKKIHKKW